MWPSEWVVIPRTDYEKALALIQATRKHANEAADTGLGTLEAHLQDTRRDLELLPPIGQGLAVLRGGYWPEAQIAHFLEALEAQGNQLVMAFLPEGGSLTLQDLDAGLAALLQMKADALTAAGQETCSGPLADTER